MKVFLGVIGTIVVSVVAAEFSVLAPWLAERLIRSAARILPTAQRGRYVAEWLGELSGVPGQFLKLLFAIRLALRAPATRRGLQGLDPLWVALARRLLEVLATVARLVSHLLARMPANSHTDGDLLLAGDSDQSAPLPQRVELDTPIEDLKLEATTAWSLQRVNVLSVRDLVTRTKADLLNLMLRTPALDIFWDEAECVDEVCKELHALGLSLREE